jgi:cyclase
MRGINPVILCAAAGVLAFGAHVFTQGAPRPAANWGASGDIHTFHVQGKVHLVVGAGGNVAVQAGDDGVLFVDTGMAAHADKLLGAVRKDLSDGPIRWVVNTHADEDHTGGNEVIGKAGSTTNNNPTPIVAHENVLTRMSLPTGGRAPRPTAAWPTSSYVKTSKDFFFNDEPVMVYHVPSAHTDGDSVVMFRRSDVVMAGDLYDTTAYPRIDLAAGGGVQGLIDGLNLILDLAVPKHEQEGGTYVIPGHGRVSDEADVLEYRDMVTIVRDRIADMVSRNATLDQVKAARPTLDYDRQYGATSGPSTTTLFVESIYQDLRQRAGGRK